MSKEKIKYKNHPDPRLRRRYWMITVVEKTTVDKDDKDKDDNEVKDAEKPAEKRERHINIIS